MAIPKSSVKQLKDRARAELAAQGGFPNTSDARVGPNLVQKEQGVLIARQKAATAVDFDAHAASVRNIENIQAHSQRMANARQLADATAEGPGELFGKCSC